MNDWPVIHTATFGEKFTERLLGMIEIQSFEVFGNTNAEAKEALTVLERPSISPLADSLGKTTNPSHAWRPRLGGSGKMKGIWIFCSIPRILA